MIDTGGFNEKTFIDATGAPQTDELRTVSASAGSPQGNLGTWLEGYVSGEPHRDLSGVRRA